MFFLGRLLDYVDFQGRAGFLATHTAEYPEYHAQNADAHRVATAFLWVSQERIVHYFAQSGSGFQNTRNHLQSVSLHQVHLHIL
jgi:hypothetical protein